MCGGASARRGLESAAARPSTNRLRRPVPPPRCAVEERSGAFLLLTRETGEVDQRAIAR